MAFSLKKKVLFGKKPRSCRSDFRTCFRQKGGFFKNHLGPDLGLENGNQTFKSFSPPIFAAAMKDVSLSWKKENSTTCPFCCFDLLPTGATFYFPFTPCHAKNPRLPLPHTQLELLHGARPKTKDLGIF